MSLPTLFSVLFLIALLLGCTSLVDLQTGDAAGDPPCNYASQVCGSLSIPYPFGMSNECGLPGYRISCKRNASYGDGDLAFLQIGTTSTPELPVQEFATNTLVVNSTLLKAMPSPSECKTEQAFGRAGLELVPNGPFLLSDNNWFVVVGCRAYGNITAFSSSKPGGDTIECETACYNEFDMPFCNTYACCINAIPPKSWRLQFYGKGIGYELFPDVCGFSTVLTPSTYKVPANEVGFFSAGQYGLSISWALQLLDNGQNCSTAMQRPDYACSDVAECIDDASIHGYTCNCTQGYRGDGYKAGIGCQDIDECEEKLDDCEGPPLGMCINTVGSYNCTCLEGGGGSGLPGTCPLIHNKANVLLPALLGGLAGVVILSVVLVFACISRRAYRQRRKRQENFQRIGGEQLKSFLFSERELMKATNGFSNSHVIGEGGFGKVYWGKLSTEHGTITVAIKRAKPKAVEEQVAQMQSFVKEILLLSSIVHKNVVRLLGCCVETSVPLLVYEFVEKGTLQEYLKPQGRDCYMVLQGGRARHGSATSLWAWRLHIAVETAEALNHLHSRSEPIFHLDMKSANILIDKQFNPKVADFGLSCFVDSDATHLTNPLQAGTFGYFDPEYYHSWRITEKCDVYSFGVILLELISSWPACNGPGAVLAHEFRTAINMEEEIEKHGKQLPSFIDSRLESYADVLVSINDVAKLARTCVALRGSDRPSMQEVLAKLRQIQSRHVGKQKFKATGGRGSPDRFSFPSSTSLGNSEEIPLVAIPSDQLQYSASSSSSIFPPQNPSDDQSGSIASQSTGVQLQEFVITAR